MDVKLHLHVVNEYQLFPRTNQLNEFFALFYINVNINIQIYL